MKKFDFHGSFIKKSSAVAKEKTVPGGFIIEQNVLGKKRYFVVTIKNENK
jgi:hypothetical protein